jgi:hypothetical protein
MPNENAERMEGISDVFSQIKTLSAWMPAIGFCQRFLAEPDVAKRAVIVGDGLEWLASRTDTKVDDVIADDVTELLKTPQAEKLVKDLVSLAESVIAKGEVKP